MPNVNTTELMALLWSQLWQVTLVAGVVALLVRWLAKNRPHLAHVLWLLVLLKCLTPPLWSSPGGVFCWLQANLTPAEAAVHDTATLPTSPRDMDDEYADADVVVHAPPREAAAAGLLTAFDQSDFKAMSTKPAANAKPWNWRTRILALLSAVWLLGMILVVAAGAWRWLRCWSMLRRADVIDNPHVAAQVARLAKRLHVRRPVRLLITNSRLGPAVIGVLRPLIVLPLAVVEGKSAAQLEPILAHELLHIRRGDLWISLLQTLAQAVWWFHPLVWLASRLISREAERCCDEQVVAELGCPPATYAHSLLDVLDLKRTLIAVPTFPGVRPVEVTSKRLERIMQLGHGCRKRTPWWCWMLFAVLAAAALPGAAFQATAGENGGGKRDPNKTDEQWTPVGAEPSLVVIYKVDGLLKRIKDEYHVGGDRARKILRDYLPAGPLAVDENFAWHDDGLVVLATHDRHQEISKYLDLLRKTGFRTIRFETIIATADKKFVDKIIGDWQVLPGEEQETETAIDFNAMTFDDVTPVERIAGKRAAQGQATQITERRTPAAIQVLDEQRRAALIQALQGDARSNMLTCPKVTLFDRQKAVIANTVQHPYVVGVKRNNDGGLEPNIRVVNEGLIVRLHPQLEGDAKLRLSCGVTFSDIRDVDTTTIPRAGQEPITLQVPEVATMKVDSLAQLQDGQTLAIGGMMRRKRDGKLESLLVLIRAHVVPLLDKEDAETADAAPPVAQDVADPTADYHFYQGAVDRRLAADDREADVEAAMTRAWQQKVDVAWSGTPLEDAIASLAKNANLNIAIDSRALMEEGVDPTTKVSLQLKRVQVQRVLKLLLEPLDLTFRVEDEVVHVTSAARARGKKIAMVYHVADLVVPVPSVVRYSPSGAGRGAAKPQPAVGFDSLIELITSTIAPGSWDQVGGPGAISGFETNLSLVVLQTQDVHEEIVDLLEQLRRLQDLQVTFTVRTAHVSAKGFESITRHPQVLNAEQLLDLRRSLDMHDSAAAIRTPQVTLFNGQGLELEMSEEAAAPWMRLQPIVSPDRRSVQLRLAVSTEDDSNALASAESVVVPDGGSIVFDLSEEFYTRRAAPAGVVHTPHVRDLLAKSLRRRGGERTLCIITPRIIVQEEEEVRAIPAMNRR